MVKIKKKHYRLLEEEFEWVAYEVKEALKERYRINDYSPEVASCSWEYDVDGEGSVRLTITYKTERNEDGPLERGDGAGEPDEPDN